MTQEGMPSFSDEEKVWRETGGISPRRITRLFDRNIMSGIARHYPEMLGNLKATLIEDIQRVESQGILLALNYVYLVGVFHEYPVKLGDLVCGVFVDKVQELWDARLALGEEPNGTPIDEARWRGEELVKRLTERGFLRSVAVPSDDWTTWDGFGLAEKGQEFMRLLLSTENDGFVEAAKYLREHFYGCD